jgi:hypothetical protein
MPPSAALREAQQLHWTSKRLDTLADQHPLISEALITISGNVRHTDALLEPNQARQTHDCFIFYRNGVVNHEEWILRRDIPGDC